MKPLKLPLFFSMLLIIIGMLTMGCVQEEKQPVLQKSDANVVQYKDEYTVPLPDQSLVKNIQTYVSKSKKTSEDLGESLFKVIYGDQTYLIYKKGFETASVKYLYEDDLSPLLNQLYKQFNRIQHVTIKEMAASKIRIHMKDHSKILQATDELYKLIMEELPRSTTLQDPPMIYGTSYPYLEVNLGNALVLTWIVPDIATIKMSDHITGYIQFSSSSVWNKIKENNPPEFERTGNFAVQTFKVRFNDIEYQVDNQYNRLDELARLLKKIEQEKPITSAEKKSPPAIVIQNAAGEKPYYEIYPDDRILYNGKTYKINQFYEDIVSFLSVP